MTIQAAREGGSGACKRWSPLPLSGDSPYALEQLTRSWVELFARPGADVQSVSRTLVGKPARRHRRCAVCFSPEDAARALSTLDCERVVTARAGEAAPPVAFMFSGIGDHHAGMGRSLYESQPRFRQAFEECARITERLLGVNLHVVLYCDQQGIAEQSAQGVGFLGRIGRKQSGSPALRSARCAHPAVFAMDYALGQCLTACGVRPAVVFGQSLGEYVAAVFAGVLDLADALEIVCERARIIDGLPEGAMLAVCLGRRELLDVLPHSLDLAIVNSPCATVVSGAVPDVNQFAQTLHELGIAYLPLEADRAIHSRHMRQAADSLGACVRRMSHREPSVKFLTNLSGGWQAQEPLDALYWGEHLCQTVQFERAVSRLLTETECLVIEVGPGQTLASFVRQNDACDERRASLVRAASSQSSDQAGDAPAFLACLAFLWAHGVNVDWKALGQGVAA